MRIRDVTIDRSGARCRVQATVESAAYRRDFSIWYEIPNISEATFIEGNCDAFLPIVILPAMCLGEAVYVEGSVSAQLARGICEIQRIYHCWHPKLSIVEVTADEQVNTQHESNQNALFFSGGVDSLYSLVQRYTSSSSSTTRIGNLILVQGFDIPLSERGDSFFQQATLSAKQLASHFAVGLHTIRTNIREFVDQFVPWGLLGHGPALAGAGLSLQALFSTIYIASTVTSRDLFAWGSHPLTDPLWSNETLTFVHDGADRTRLEKIRSLYKSQAGVDSLRVCWKTLESLNCGSCEKCLRTMVALRVVGAKSKSFPDIDFERIRDVKIDSAVSLLQWTELLMILNDLPQEKDLQRAVSDCVARAAPVSSSKEFDPASLWIWQACAKRLDQAITGRLPADSRFVLIDQEEFRSNLENGSRAIPFINNAGECGGLPADDAEAIGELQKARTAGAAHVILTSSAVWILEHYEAFNQYLESNFARVEQNQEFKVFELRPPSG
jgi:hypothetical protein